MSPLPNIRSREFGEIQFGDPVLVIWGDCLGEMRVAKVDVLGRGEVCGACGSMPGMLQQNTEEKTAKMQLKGICGTCRRAAGEERNKRKAE